jgi:uncharacterized pyridoxal phosphate-containing UPF0001 family protein
LDVISKKPFMIDVAAGYQKIMSRIGETAAKADRDPKEIKLVAAAKAQSAESIRAAIAAGVTLIGENYVQEAAEKKKAIQEPVEWHMIGHLQRNKAKIAAGIFDMIESLDNVAIGSRYWVRSTKIAKSATPYYADPSALASLLVPLVPPS